jgi:hypothetical protein
MTKPEDWWCHPAKCDHWTRATDLGIVRMGAKSKGKKIMMRCPGPGCDGRFRWAELLAQPPGWEPPEG